MPVPHPWQNRIWRGFFFLLREEKRRTWRKPVRAKQEPTTNNPYMTPGRKYMEPGHIGGRLVLSLLGLPYFSSISCGIPLDD